MIVGKSILFQLRRSTGDCFGLWRRNEERCALETIRQQLVMFVADARTCHGADDEFLMNSQKAQWPTPLGD